MTNKIILLGKGTFTEKAYENASRIFEIPDISNSQILRVDRNEQIIPLLRQNEGAYSCLPIKTHARGKITTNIRSLLITAPFNLVVIGGMKERIKIGLHMKKEARHSDIDGLIGHEEALSVCMRLMQEHGITEIISVENNSLGMEMVRGDRKYKNWAALGPNQTAQDLGLVTLNKDCGDFPTYTSFLILHHGASHVSKLGDMNSALLFFTLKNKPGAICEITKLLAEFQLRYIQQSNHLGEKMNRFAIEVEISKGQILNFHKAQQKIREVAEDLWVLGPYERI